MCLHQLKQYMADFRKEREMRESAFQVKEMAERKQHELSSEVSQLQRQLTEMQTVKHMDSDVGNVRGVGGYVVHQHYCAPSHTE